MSWLVTGGAGYIGSHVVRAFAEQGIDTVVVDDLSSGRRGFLPPGTPFVQGTILDGALLEADPPPRRQGVVHLAGFKYAGVSVPRPLHTYQQNVTGTATLLAAMEATGVDRIVFSSSAAVYGTPDVDLVTEATPQHPESPYGESKLIGEWLLADQARATGLRHTSLRYFNVVGSGTREVFDPSPHNLFPLVFDALIEGRTPRINGDDYPTPDGTCVRDYIHVADLADAHVVARRASTRARGSSRSTTSARATASRSARSCGRRGRHRHRVRARDRAAPSGRPRPDRRLGRTRGARPRLAHAALLAEMVESLVRAARRMMTARRARATGG